MFTHKKLKAHLSTIAKLAVIATCLHATAFAATTEQQQIQKLQKEIQKLNEHVYNANYSTKTQHSLANSDFIGFDDASNEKKFEQFDSSDIPLSLLKVKSLYPDSSIVFGGLFEFEPYNSWYGDKFTDTSAKQYHNGTAASVSDINFDALANVNSFTQVFTQFAYTGGTGNISLMSGFATFGNLKKSPVFLSFGKSRVRFGLLPGAPWAPSIPQGIFRPAHLINATLGYSRSDFSAYLAYLPTDVSNQSGVSRGRKPGVMASAFYEGKVNKSIAYNANVGVVSDIASTGSQVGTAVADAPNYQQIPALNVEGDINVGPVDFAGGYQTTLKNSEYTGAKDAKASSYYSQVSYTTNIMAKNVIFAVNYNKASNTQDVDMPVAGDIETGPAVKGIEKNWLAYAFTHINRSLGLGVEYARMTSYDKKDTNAVTVYSAVYF